MTPQLDVHTFAKIAEALDAASTPAQTADEIVAQALAELGADYGGITLLRRGGRLETVAATSVLVEKVDALQYELDEGSCRDSTWSGGTLTSPDLATDPRWPHWAPKAAALGVASVLSVELSDSDGRRIGSVNMYWRDRRSFSSDEVAFASVFARHAALALAASMKQAGLNNMAHDGRKLIGQAEGILMERHGLDEQRAFEVLRRYSRDKNLKMRHVAEYLVSTRYIPPDKGATER